MPRKPVRVLLNAIDLVDFDRNLGDARSQATRDPTQVLMVGHLIQAKRVDRFLEALSRARKSRRSLHGVIVGDGPLLKELESQAGELRLLPDGVRFIGRRDDVPALLSQSAMLVCTSDHEGFANVLLEAMAARLPVITTPAGDAAQVVQDCCTGYVVDFEDIEGLAARIVQLADSEDLRRRFGDAGRKRVEDDYGVGNLAERLLTVYRSVAEDSGHQDLASRVEGASSAAITRRVTR
jgi:glycosyltransferase involved in cell wall biosynthesis